MSVRPATLALIEDAHRFSAFYRGELANHLPMALVALEALGAGDEAIRRFAARYCGMLEPMPERTAPIGTDREAWLGRRDAFAAWVEHFAARLSGEEPSHVLADAIALLMPGVGSGAFHGLIRTAYALESLSRRETAHALAYWASAYDAPAAKAVPSGIASPQELLASLASHPDYGGRRRAGANIATRMRSAAAEPGFEAVVSKLAPRALTIDALARALIGCYAASGNFTVLHAVTGCHAFRTLMPFLAGEKTALEHFWRALAAAYIGAGSPTVEGGHLGGDTGLDWDAIRGLAVACEDEHDVKLVFTCWREWQHRGGDVYRRVASSRVTLAANGRRAA
jgi:hypothetical protein